MSSFMLFFAIVAACFFGGLIMWFIARIRTLQAIQNEQKTFQEKYDKLENETIHYKATSTAQMERMENELSAAMEEASRANSDLAMERKAVAELRGEVAGLAAIVDADKRSMIEKNNDLLRLREALKEVQEERDGLHARLATATATNKAQEEKLALQKEEMESMGKKFNLEFENIANKLLESKGEKFTELHRTNLRAILEPLSENIAAFKKQVEEVYDKESKERFSLGQHVKELALLNKVISEEAQNLTRALKGESKKQGDWGQMILENILEKSGLRKGHEYFLEHQLTDDSGRAMRSESEGKKMRPDVLIRYPDNRNVIIDSKVSLNAFTRMVECEDEQQQQAEAAAHVSAIKNHIVALSTKGYDDFQHSLDFVMMFIPSESAYMAALRHDENLWNFAYDRRILLLSPTNLITSLKLIVDLWKREYQNQNALEIAERGAKLYDKFVGFTENLSGLGDALEKAMGKYESAYKQLSTGNDNLIIQATKLKNLGLKTKKSLPEPSV